MNRTLKIVFSTLGVLTLLLFVAPFILKNSILNQLKLAVSAYADGTIKYETGDLSLFRTFPNLTVDIEDVSYTKEQDTVSIDHCKLALNLFSVLNGKPYEISEIAIVNPIITIHKPSVQTPKTPEISHSDSKTGKDSSRPENRKSAEKKPLLFSLKKVNISNGTFLLNNSESNFSLTINGFNLESFGTLSSITDRYTTEISAAAIDLSLANLEYIKQQQLSIKNTLSFHKERKLLTVESCQIKLNQFESFINGTILQNGNSLETNLTLDSQHLTLKKALSLLYAPHSNVYNQIDAQGDVAFNGFLKGRFNKDEIPAFQVMLKIKNGQIPLAASQDTIKQINLQLIVANSEERTYSVALSHCNFLVGNNPVEVSCSVEKMDSLFHLSGEYYTQFELADLARIIPIDSTIEVDGTLSSSAKFNTYTTNFKTIRTDSLTLDGKLEFQKCKLNTPYLVQPIAVERATISITDKKILLNEFELSSGRNRLKISGETLNFLSHFLEKKPLNGDLLIASDQLDLNALFSSYQPKQTQVKTTNSTPQKSSQPSKSIALKTAEHNATETEQITPTFKFRVTLKVAQATYNSTVLKHIASSVTVSNQQIVVSNFSFRQDKGLFSGEGKLSNITAPFKQLESSLEAQNFTFDQTLKLFPELKSSQPFLANLTGAFSLEVEGSVDISKQFASHPSTLNTKGKLTTTELHVKDITELQRIAKKAKLKPLEKVDIDPLSIVFEVKNGNLTVKPFDFKSGDISGVVSGTTSVDKLLNYTIHLKVPRKAFNGEVNAIADNVLGKLSQFGIKPKLPEAITLDVIITGPSDNPIITTQL